MSTPRTTFLNTLHAALAAAGAAGTTVLLGLSGGRDSVALLRGLVALASELEITPITVHVDHRLRDDSPADAAWVRELVSELGVSHKEVVRDVRAEAAAAGVGLEEAGRNARYDVLREIAVDRGAAFVLLAHHADDQVETVLHNLLRGTGLRGLQGMPRRRPLSESVTLLRPLLDLPGPAIDTYLADLGQDYLDDPSNASDAFTRNRLRRELLPLLEERFNPRVREALLRVASQAESAAAVVESVARARLDDALVGGTPAGALAGASTVRLCRRALHDEPEHLVRAVFVELWRRLDWPRQRMGQREWSRLATLARQPTPAISLPHGIAAHSDGDAIVLRRTSS